MKPDLSCYLGRRVRVVVDRPLGSAHPRHPDLTYPVNYGEVPGTLSGDGHPIDAYLVGWDAPLTDAQGVVVAVVVRPHDAEDKLIVTPEGAAFSVEALRAAVDFQERYFEGSTLIPGTLGA